MTSGRSIPDIKPRPLDLLVVLFVVVLAAGTAFFAYRRDENTGLTATVKHGGKVVAQVELSTLTEEKQIAVDGTYHLVISLTREGACVARSDCPGQDCVHSGTITGVGQSIVCLPEKVIVSLEGSAPSPDVVLR